MSTNNTPLSTQIERNLRDLAMLERAEFRKPSSTAHYRRRESKGAASVRQPRRSTLPRASRWAACPCLSSTPMRRVTPRARWASPIPLAPPRRTTSSSGERSSRTSFSPARTLTASSSARDASTCPAPRSSSSTFPAASFACAKLCASMWPRTARSTSFSSTVLRLSGS